MSKSCNNKIQYPTRKAARLAKRVLRHKKKRILQVYYCEKHNCYHLGNSPFSRLSSFLIRKPKTKVRL